MGRKLDALLGRSFKPYKFKALLNLAVSRLTVLKNQHQVRCNHARSDVLQLLQLGHHDRALLRVEHVIKEQRMLDVFAMLDCYINIVVERVDLVEHERVCPDEMKEAVSGLMYASSRCGDFPELQELRSVFTSRFGKEFAASAIELRNNCGVNPKMLQKLSTRQLDLEAKTNILKEIASENNITLQLEEASSDPIQGNSEASKQNPFETGPSTHLGSMKLGGDLPNFSGAIGDDGFTDSMLTRRKYRDVADAAQAAFQSAAYAAEAARAAVELSRSQPHDSDGSDTRHGKACDTNVEVQQMEDGSDSKMDTSSSSESARDNLTVPTMSFDGVEQTKLLEKDLIFDESDDDEESHSIKEGSFLEKDPSLVHIPARVETGLKLQSESSGPLSVRTRQVRGY